MLDIFDFSENKAFPTMECLTHPILKQIWERDTSAHKGEAIIQYSYLNYVCSYKKSNPFIGYVDLEERKTKILQHLVGKDDADAKFIHYDNDTILLAAETALNTLYEDSIPSLRFYKDAMDGIDKLSRFLRTIDLTAKNEKTGSLVYTPKMVQDIIKDSKSLALALNELKDIVNAEITEATRSVKNRQINFFEIAENAEE